MAVASFDEPLLARDSCIAEDKANSLWITTVRGLAHYAVDDTGGVVSLRKLGDYTLNVPRRGSGLWVDAEGSLWTRTGGGAGERRLWRIEVK